MIQQELINIIGNNPVLEYKPYINRDMLNSIITYGCNSGFSLAHALITSEIGCDVLAADNNRLISMVSANSLKKIISHVDAEGKSALWQVAHNAQWDIFQYLLRYGADVNVTPKTGLYAGISVLWISIYYNRPDIAKELIAKGANIHVTPTSCDYADQSILWIAASEGEWGIFEYLLKYGTDINAMPTTGISAGQSILWLSIIHKQFDIAKKIISLGARVNEVPVAGSDAGTSALWNAAYYQQDELFENLVENGADINAVALNGNYAGTSVLWLRALNNQVDIHSIKRLMSKDVNIHLIPSDGFFAGISVLWLAAYHQRWDVAQYLIENGANINAVPTNCSNDDVSFLSLLAFYDKIDEFWPLIERFNLDKSISPSSIMQYKNDALKIAEYKMAAPILNGIYIGKDISYKNCGLTKNSLGIFTSAKKILGHVCDDNNAKRFDAEGYFGLSVCIYLINVSKYCERQIKSNKIKNIFDKTKKYMLAIEDGYLRSNYDTAIKMKFFFENDTLDMLVTVCPIIKHDILAKLVRNNEGLYLFIYNDGEGLSHHKKNSKTNRYSNSIAYKLPNVMDKNSSTIMIDLLVSDINITTEEFYNQLQEVIFNINAIQVDIELSPTTGQRSGTCVLKSMRSLLQGVLSREEYLLHKFFINTATINECYNLAKASDRLLVFAEQIIEACDNVSRLKDKIFINAGDLLDDEIRGLIMESISKIQNIKKSAQSNFLDLNLIFSSFSNGHIEPLEDIKVRTRHKMAHHRLQ